MTEVELWSGERKSLTNAASGGKVAGARYRVTDRAVYASVGLVRNSENQLPLHLVSDVDVRQGMAQRARGVGDVVVHARHSDGTLDARWRGSSTRPLYGPICWRRFTPAQTAVRAGT